MPTGKVFGLGVGPGDPELMTLKALRLLRAAPVVAYPAPLGGESFARAIVAQWLTSVQQEIVIAVPMETSRFPAQEVYDRAAAEIGAHLAAGRDVAVLCQGDPFFYGSFMYLFGRLATDYTVEVVPGVSSLAACAAAARSPLASRNEALDVLPGPMPETELEARLREAPAAAVIKLGRHFPKIRRILDRLQLTDHAWYVEHATLASERVLPVSAVDAESVPYFAMVLVRRDGPAWQ